MIQEERIHRPRVMLGLFAFLTGCIVNYIGDRILGVRIELYWGLETFNLLWFLQLFVWPVVVGIIVALIFRRGGKWLAMFPPLAVRAIAYWETMYLTGVPEGAALNNPMWWGFYVILAMECAMIGGVFGEIWSKRAYGRSDSATPAPVPETPVNEKTSVNVSK